MAHIKRTEVTLVVTLTVPTTMTAHDAAHQVAGTLTGAGWAASASPLGLPPGMPEPGENRITAVHLDMVEGADPTAPGPWVVSVVKCFAPENGGGFQTFKESGGGQVHRALDVARGMVTLSPGHRVQPAPAQAEPQQQPKLNPDGSYDIWG